MGLLSQMTPAVEVIHLHVNTYTEHGIISSNYVAVTVLYSLGTWLHLWYFSSIVNFYVAVTQDILESWCFFPHRIELVMQLQQGISESNFFFMDLMCK